MSPALPEPPPPYLTQRVFPKLLSSIRSNWWWLREAIDGLSSNKAARFFRFPIARIAPHADLLARHSQADSPLAAPYGGRRYVRLGVPSAIRRKPLLLRLLHRELAKPGDTQLPDGTRISRFRVVGDPPRIDPESEKIVITWLGGGHNGGSLKFGPDGYLYISTGDGGNPNPPDPHDTGQDISDLLSSILRIDVDHASGDRPYSIPRRQSVCQNARRSWRNLGLRLAQSVANELRSPDRRSMGRRCRLGIVGDRSIA